MWLAAVIDVLTTHSRRTRTGRPRRTRIRKQSASPRLALETLEDRCLLSFLPAVNYATGPGPQSVATADFNADGHADLVTANGDTNTISVFLGNGGGTLQNAQTYLGDYYPQALAVGDFNNDGKLDIATANGLSGNGNGTVSVFLGNGDGTFQPALNYALPTIQDPYTTGGQAPLSVAVGDFNKDGNLDLAVTANVTRVDYYGYFNGYNGYVNVLLGNGAGSFSADNLDALSGGVPSSIAVADCNGDTNLDLAIAENDTNVVSVLLGDGSGAFGTGTDFATGAGPQSVAIGDVNGDGVLDLVTGGANVSVLLGSGNGTFQNPLTSTAGVTTSVTAVAIADVNGDGKPDLAVANFDAGLSVLLGNGDGTFQYPLTSAAGVNPTSVAIGDFNGDGFPDLAVGNNGSSAVAVLLNGADWSTVGAPTDMVVSGFPSTISAGVPGNITVTVRDNSGNAVPGYQGTVHFSSSDGQAVLPGDYTFTAADGGVHTFAATLKTVGTQSLTASDIAATSLISSETGISVNPAAASTFAVTGFPSSTTAGVAHNFTVTALDPYGNLATGYQGTVHFSSSDTQAVLPANSTLTNGTGQFRATFNTAGTQSLTATDSADGNVTGAQLDITVHPAVKTLAVAGFPSPTTAGVSHTFTITAHDANGNIATWYTGTVAFSSSDGQAVLPGWYTFTTADNGVHTFGATLKTAGTQSITARDTMTAGLGGSEAGITVNPAAASHFMISAPATVSAGVPFSLTVTVVDAYGNVVTGYTGTIHFTSTDKRATLPADYTFTAADKGVHTFSGVVLRKKGSPTTITITDTRNSSITGTAIEKVV